MASRLCESEKELTYLFIKVIKQIISEKAIRERLTSTTLTEETDADIKQTTTVGPKSVSFTTFKEFYSTLLEANRENDSGRNVFLNSPYPKYPLYENFAIELFQWVKTFQCPFLFQRTVALLNEEPSKERRASLYESCKDQLQKIRDFVDEICDSLVVNEHTINSQDDIFIDSSALAKFKWYVSGLLDVLGERGIMYVLGLRDTAGSIIKAPPPSSRLVESFVRLQNDKSKLTVGARALSKHFHRCRSEWWGECKGTEAQKNEHALDILQKIVHDGVWINVHMLPHDCEVIEIRCNDGYGARWTSDGSKFRGFLEPQMEDGHAVHWRH